MFKFENVRILVSRMSHGIFGPLIGAIDEGTSSARFIVFKLGSSEVVTSHQVDLEQLTPQEGWLEQDPMQIMNVVYECIDVATKQLEDLGGKITVRFCLNAFDVL